VRSRSESQNHQREADLFTNLHCFSEVSIPGISGTKNSAISANVNTRRRSCCFTGTMESLPDGFFKKVLRQSLYQL